MEQTELTSLSLARAAVMIRRHELSPLELTEACLTRIERLNPKLNTFISVMADEALLEARHATEGLGRGEHWGPLHGIPIAVKDLIDVAGQKTTAGSLFFKDNTAHEDADVVRQLRAAGAIIIGKTNLHEFAIGATNVNPHYGPAHNPWNQDYSPGGSSGGSAAAVASLLCLGALGSDTGGSVRMPAALCGLTGLRPGKNRVSTHGTVPMSWTLDSIGPLAHTARDVALLLDAMDNQPIMPANCILKLDEPAKGLRIGLPPDNYFWLESDLQVVSAVRKAVDALVDLGMELVEVEIPQIKGIQRAASVISMADAAAFHQERLESQPERFGDDVRTRLEWGMRRSGVEYSLARQSGREWQAFMRTLFREHIDVLALPTTPLAAQPIAGTEAISAAKEMLRFTYPFSLSGMAAISIPCGFTDDGFPIGIQLVAPGESVLTQVANAYQQLTPWHLRRPEFPE
jgi:aspartyl-tRNA(Asn)/glutamyl-tRNA(Gln) amidotransferase subunit A